MTNVYTTTITRANIQYIYAEHETEKPPNLQLMMLKLIFMRVQSPREMLLFLIQYYTLPSPL